MTFDARRAVLILASLLISFIALRTYLYFSPGTNLDIAGYNIHHLFTGLLLIALGGLPLTLFSGNPRILDVAALLFGTGISLAMDEWIYLIVTDGSDASYWLAVSFWGAIIMISLLLMYILGLWLAAKIIQRNTY